MNPELEAKIEKVKAMMAKHGEGTAEEEKAGAAGVVKLKPCGRTFPDAGARTDVKLAPPVVLGLNRKGTVGGIVAETGLGKSIIAADYTYKVSTGGVFWDMAVVNPGKAIWFDLELPESLVHGAEGRLSKHFGDKLATATGALHVPMFDLTVADPTQALTIDVEEESFGPHLWKKKFSVDTLERRLEVEVAAAGWKREELASVVIDGAAEFFGGKVDTNNNGELREIIMALRLLAARWNIAIVLIFHPGKGENSKKYAMDLIRGGSSQPDTLDYLLTLVYDAKRCNGDEVVARVEAPKMRLFPHFKARWIRREGLSPFTCTEPPKKEGSGEPKKAGRVGGYDWGKIAEAFQGKAAGAVLSVADLQRAGVAGNFHTAKNRAEKAVGDGRLEKVGGTGYRLAAGGGAVSD